MNRIRSSLALAVATATLLAVQPAEGQDVQYETVSKFELAGAAGTAMRIAASLGGGSTESVETTYIKGRKMRTDSDGSSTIIDLDAGRFTLLDHKARTYSTFTFEEMAQKAQEVTSRVREDRQEATGQGGAEAEFEFRFSVDQANERQRIAGYDAERFFLTMEAEAEAVPEGGTGTEAAGTFVVLTDIWAAKDIPILQARSPFDDASAQRYAEAGAALSEGFAAAFADDPRIKVAFEQSVSEARKIEGMAVRSVMSFVTVAPGKRFDRAMITDAKAEEPSLAQQAGRAALGGIMGRLGRRAAAPEPTPEPEVSQATLFTVTSEVRNVTTGTVDPSQFEVPAGYTQVEI
jgi:hypothetical protein